MEIEFRAMNMFGDWVFGSLVIEYENQERYWIYGKDYIKHIVNKKETVGQFTGLLDKNGNKIFEGDIIRADGSHYLTVVIDEHTGGYKGQAVVWDKHEDDDYNTECDYFEMAEYEVIGNIHDNKELLENGK